MSGRRHVIVMLTTSYPRFPGDGVGSFIEPMAKGMAARGHEVHLVAPWHSAMTRGRVEDGVYFHLYRYAPLRSLNVFGYAEGLRADTHLKLATWIATPSAFAAGAFKARRVADKRRATVIHAHWVIPGGVMGALAAGRRPLVVSLHGSDVFVAERHRAIGRAARAVFARAAWTSACSDDLRARAIRLGAPASRIDTVPYGVDTTRFAPRADLRAAVRHELAIGDAPLVVAAGRLVRKKGFSYLIDAAAPLAARVPGVRVIIAGDGDLRAELAARAAAHPNVALLGSRSQDDVARLLAAADVAVVPSVHDDAGNVDGLPNFALEALASATPVVATQTGGLPQVITDGLTGRLVPERDAGALASVIGELLDRPAEARACGQAGRALVERDFGWARVAERFVQAYDRAVG